MATTKPAAKSTSSAKAPAPRTVVAPSQYGSYRAPDGTIKQYNAPATGKAQPVGATNKPDTSSNSGNSSNTNQNTADTSGNAVANTNGSSPQNAVAFTPIQFSDNGNPMFKQLGDAFNNLMAQEYAQGTRLNPNFQLTGDQLQGYLDTAASQLSPYYQGQYNTYKNDLTTHLNNLSQNAETTNNQTAQGFNTDLRNSQNFAAEHGMALSGQRVQDESNLAKTAQYNIDTTTRNYNDQAQSTYNDALRNIGNANVGSIAPRQLSSANIAGSFTPGQTAASYSPDTAGLNPQYSRTLSPAFNLSTGVTGSIESAQQKDTIQRSLAAATAYANQQARTLYGGSTTAGA